MCNLRKKKKKDFPSDKKKKKNGTNEPIYKTEIESQMLKINLGFPKVKGEGGINWEVGNDIHILLHWASLVAQVVENLPAVQETWS